MILENSLSCFVFNATLSHVTQAGLKSLHVTKEDLELFLGFHPECWDQGSISTFLVLLCSTVESTPGFVHVRQTHYHLSYNPSPGNTLTAFESILFPEY